MLGRQAKVLSDMQIRAVLSALDGGRNGLRNKVMFLLSLHGLRAKEISALEVSMVTDAEGRLADSIRLENKAAKGVSGRVIPMSDVLRSVLIAYLDSREHGTGRFVVATERRERFSAHAVVVFFARLYKRMGFQGATSHSGRRTYITRAAERSLKLEALSEMFNFWRGTVSYPRPSDTSSRTGRLNVRLLRCYTRSREENSRLGLQRKIIGE